MKAKIATIAALCAMLEMILAPQQMIESGRYALSLCAELIIPSLFPFFVLSGLLNRLGFAAAIARQLAKPAARLYGVSGAGATAFFMGLVGGYPLGAAYIADMRRQGLVSLEEAERLMGFCSNSGPAFLVGSIGAGVFGSARLGVGLYIIHVLAAAITGLFFRVDGKCRGNAPAAPRESGGALIESVRQAAQSILSVCGFIVCFCVIIGLLDAHGMFCFWRDSSRRSQDWSFMPRERHCRASLSLAAVSARCAVSPSRPRTLQSRRASSAGAAYRYIFRPMPCSPTAT